MKTGTLIPLYTIYGNLPATMAEVKVRENVWLSKPKILFLNNFFIFMHVSVHEYAICVVWPAEARKGHLASWSWS